MITPVDSWDEYVTGKMGTRGEPGDGPLSEMATLSSSVLTSFGASLTVVVETGSSVGSYICIPNITKALSKSIVLRIS